VNTASQIKHTEADPDFVRIRDKPRFRQMLEATKGRLGIAQTLEAKIPQMG
jgi:hypothetical protein